MKNFPTLNEGTTRIYLAIHVGIVESIPTFKIEVSPILILIGMEFGIPAFEILEFPDFCRLC